MRTSAGFTIDAVKADRLFWIAYPKAGKLKTDLNREKLHGTMETYGIEGVRLVSIDDVWSAMRFRPKKEKKGKRGCGGLISHPGFPRRRDLHSP